MRELRYGEQMQDYTCSTGYQIKWTFPENVHIIKDTLYEIEYQVTKDYRQCVYKVTHIKPVNEYTYEEGYEYDMEDLWLDVDARIDDVVATCYLISTL